MCVMVLKGWWWGHTLKSTIPPPEEKESSSVGKEEEEEEERGRGFVVVVCDLQGEPKMSACVLQSPVLSRGMLMTSPAVKPCPCSFSRLR